MEIGDIERIWATFHKDFKIIKQLVYDRCSLEMLNIETNGEGKEYGACSFTLDGKNVQYRASKISPTKIGQFVTVWKRNMEGITEPFHILDNVDLIIITARSGIRLGQFIFPKAVLAHKGVITTDDKIGKRGIRVYPPWDFPTNKQGLKTQAWQKDYFLVVDIDGSTDLDLAKRLFAVVG